MIHPQALVDPAATVAPGVTIGAFSIVEAGVEIGPDTWIGPHVVIREGVKIGAGNKIYQFASIGEDPQFIGYQGESTQLEIGDGNTIREYCTLNRGSPAGSGVTRIGNHNFIMAYVHIAHDCEVGDNTIFANGASVAGHVSVGDYAVMGGFSLVHQFCRVGPHCLTGIAAVCVKDVPPYIIVSGDRAKPHGINSKGLRRRGFTDDSIQALRRTYREIFRSEHSLEDALNAATKDAQHHPEIKEMIEFIRSSERGIIR